MEKYCIVLASGTGSVARCGCAEAVREDLRVVGIDRIGALTAVEMIKYTAKG